MTVHLVKEQKGSLVIAKCGYERKVALFAAEFTGFDSRVTCENCKPIRQVPGQPRRVRIKSKSRVLGRNQ